MKYGISMNSTKQYKEMRMKIKLSIKIVNKNKIIHTKYIIKNKKIKKSIDISCII